MSLLEAFEVVDAVTGMPTVSITKNGIAFNKTVLEKMGCPEYVRAMIDKPGKRIAIAPCEKEDRGSRAFYKRGRNTANGVRWNNFDLRTTIETMMGWALADQGWKASGFYSEEDNAIIFDLNSAEPLSRG